MLRVLPVVVLVATVALGSYASAQDKPVVVSEPRYTTDVMRKRISGETLVFAALPTRRSTW